MKFQISRFMDRQQAAAIRLQGSFMGPEAGARLESALGQLIGQGAILLVCSGAELHFMDWNSASALVAHVLRAQMRGGSIVLAELSKPVEEMLFDRFDVPLMRVDKEQEGLMLPIQPAAPPDWWFWPLDLRLLAQGRLEDDVTVIELIGSLYGEPESRYLKAFLEEKVTTEKIVLDMKKVATVTEAGFPVLAALKEARPEGVSWTGVTGLTREFLQMTGREDFFPSA